MSECAVWYTRYHQTYFEVADSEQEAASFAYSLEDSGDGSVLGVQFADGRVVDEKDWQALKDEGEERSRAQRAYVPPAPRPTRKVRSPFGGQVIEAEMDDPAWIGEQS